jgi:hypothetical protein
MRSREQTSGTKGEYYLIRVARVELESIYPLSIGLRPGLVSLAACRRFGRDAVTVPAGAGCRCPSRSPQAVRAAEPGRGCTWPSQSAYGCRSRGALMLNVGVWSASGRGANLTGAWRILRGANAGAVALGRFGGAMTVTNSTVPRGRLPLSVTVTTKLSAPLNRARGVRGKPVRLTVAVPCVGAC